MTTKNNKAMPKPTKICHPLVIFTCSERFKRLTKLEYLVLLIIKNFRDIKLKDNETGEYYWPDMEECANHYLGTDRFDEVLEVVICELVQKKLLAVDSSDYEKYIKLKVHDISITDLFDGGIIYDRFALKHKNFKLIDDKEAIHFRVIAKDSFKGLEECTKFGSKHCLCYECDTMKKRLAKVLGEKYPGHEDDVAIEIKVYKNMLDFIERDYINSSDSDTEPKVPYCTE